MPHDPTSSIATWEVPSIDLRRLHCDTSQTYTLMPDSVQATCADHSSEQPSSIRATERYVAFALSFAGKHAAAGATSDGAGPDALELHFCLLQRAGTLTTPNEIAEIDDLRSSAGLSTWHSRFVCASDTVALTGQLVAEPGVDAPGEAEEAAEIAVVIAKLVFGLASSAVRTGIGRRDDVVVDLEVGGT